MSGVEGRYNRLLVKLNHLKESLDFLIEEVYALGLEIQKMKSEGDSDEHG